MQLNLKMAVLTVLITSFFSCSYPSLDRFVYVNEDLKYTIATATNRCDSTIKSLTGQDETVEHLRLTDSIEELKLDVFIAIGADTVNRTLIAGAELDNTSKPTEILYTSGRAQRLKEDLIAYQMRIADEIGNADSLRFYLLPLEDQIDINGKEMSWEKRNFDRIPAAAVVVILSKLQDDLENLTCRYIELSK